MDLKVFNANNNQVVLIGSSANEMVVNSYNLSKNKKSGNFKGILDIEAMEELIFLTFNVKKNL